MECFSWIVSGVRLADGGSPNQGRVEVLYNKEWGTVCDDGWDINDAQVVCRMLNFTSASVVPIKPAFSEGKGRIWLYEVRCTGNENSLSECRYYDWGNDICDHNEDAGVICGPASSKYAPTNHKKSLLLFVQKLTNVLWLLYSSTEVAKS